MHGFLILYLFSSFAMRTVVFDAARNSRRLRMNFPITYSGFRKLQATFPHCKKPPITNSDVSDLVNPSGRWKTRQFIDRSFGAPCRKWSLQSSRPRHSIFETSVVLERDYINSAWILLRK